MKPGLTSSKEKERQLEDINFFPDVKFDYKGNRLGYDKKDSEKTSDCLTSELNQRANIPFRFWKSSFADFDTKYTDEIRNFCLSDINDSVYILLGGAGVGKTTLMVSAMHERALKGMNCGLYLSSRILPVLIRASRSFKAYENEADLYQKVTTVPFLCIDEAGTSDDLALEADFLRTVLALRYDNCLPMMLSMNMDWTMFKKFISKNNNDDPILDRLKVISRRLGFNENSYRSA